LYLDGVRWELLTLTPPYREEPWGTLTQVSRATEPRAVDETVEEGSAR
jgi:hypothetical protein